MRTLIKKITGFTLFILFFSLFFTTCKIGLGESVDTKPPTVGISYPNQKSIIRGEFVCFMALLPMKPF